MAWAIRSLSDASARIRGRFRQYMPGTDSALKNNFVTVVVKVLAALSHEFELRMAFLAKQLFVSTATGQFLALHASDVGIYRKPASAAAGKIVGTGAPNVTYPGGVRFISGNTTYITVTPASASPLGDVIFSVKSEATGSQTNRDVDGVLTVADPVLYPALSSEFLVGADGLGGGADVEDDDSLRARALHRKRNPPGGGKLSDYEEIALSVPGVIKAWAFRQSLAPGFIAVFFLFDGRPNSIPSAGDVTTVQGAIEAARLIRIDDSVVVAPTPRPIDIIINGLSNDTADVRQSIETAIAAMYIEKCRPGIAGDTFAVSRSWISEAISEATGEDRHVLALPLDDVIMTNGQFPVPGAMTYGA
ncbi:baseplate J/gp47 family protein [Rhizobium sp. NPDC090275]|uniref:baseplate J/gp47 family protein n=1 Tax=Rhizobium sp. NPDC090275 TaxID=3364498 RepID=UPI003839D048